MKPKVRNIDFIYDSEGNITDVAVRFDSYDQTDGTNFNGQVRITKESYDANATDLVALANIAMDKLKAKLGVV